MRRAQRRPAVPATFVVDEVGERRESFEAPLMPRRRRGRYYRGPRPVPSPRALRPAPQPQPITAAAQAPPPPAPPAPPHQPSKSGAQPAAESFAWRCGRGTARKPRPSPDAGPRSRSLGLARCGVACFASAQTRLTAPPPPALAI